MSSVFNHPHTCWIVPTVHVLSWNHPKEFQWEEPCTIFKVQIAGLSNRFSDPRGGPWPFSSRQTCSSSQWDAGLNQSMHLKTDERARCHSMRCCAFSYTYSVFSVNVTRTTVIHHQTWIKLSQSDLSPSRTLSITENGAVQTLSV